MRTNFALAVLLILLGAAPATQPLPPTAIPRRDFLAAFARFDAAYAAHKFDDPAARAAIHRAVDQAMERHLMAKPASAIQALNELTDSLNPAPAGNYAAALARSMHVNISPPVAWQNRPSVMRLRVARMYRVDAPLPIDFRLVIRAEQNAVQPILDVPMRVADDSPFSLVRATPQAEPGRYRIELVAPDGTAHLAGWWTIAPSSLDALRGVNDRKLVSLVPKSRELHYAITTCLGRNSLLRDQIDETSSAQDRMDPVAISREVKSEIEAIAGGANPYATRTGDWWTAVRIGPLLVPVRIYVPEQAKQRQPMPLVIAFQQMGLEDREFIDSAGGRIKQLADQHGFIVAAPRTSLLARNPGTFDNFVDAMSSFYSIDAKRVFVIGHSNGTQVAADIGSRNAAKVAGMVLIAGPNLAGFTKLPRTLMYSGGLDPFFTAEQGQESVAQARKSGIRIEHRINPQSGHVLLVDDVMDEALEWLLKPAD